MADNLTSAPAWARRSSRGETRVAASRTGRVTPDRTASRRYLLRTGAAAGLFTLMIAVTGESAGHAQSTPDLSEGTLAASTAHAGAVDLRDCPDLRRGQHDPVGGKDCVEALQAALRAHGFPRQAVTGRFLAQTEANVMDLQRRQGIRPISGIAGPLTRAALTGRAAGDTGDDQADGTAPPALTPSGAYSRTGLTGFGYRVYLRRSTTQAYTQWLAQHPWLGSAISSTLITGACRVLKLARPLTLACEILGELAADDIARQLKDAAQQGACLRVSIGLLHDGTTPRFIQARPDNTWRCTN